MRNKKAYIWTFGGRVLPQIIFLLTNIFLAHYLTPQDFGTIGILSIFISISTTLTEAGFGGSIIKEDNVSSTDLSTVFVYNLVVSLFLYSILFVSAPWLQDFYGIDDLSTIARLLGLVFVINAWALIPKTILIKELSFNKIAIVAIIGVCLASLVAIMGAFAGWGTYALVAYQLLYGLSDVICYEYLTKYKHSLTFSKESFKKLFSFGFYTTLCNILDAIYSNIMTSLFGKFLNVQSAGYLYQSQKLENSATSSLATTINTVSFPILTKLKNDRQVFSNEALSLFKCFTLFLFPLFWLTVIYATPIISIIYGEEWGKAGIYLSLLMVVGIVYVMESLTRNFIKSLGQVKELATFTLYKRIIGIGCILLCLLIKPFYMLYGYLLSSILGYVVNVYLYGKIIKKDFLMILKEQNRYVIFTLIFPVLFYILHLISNIWLEGLIILIVLGTYYAFILDHILGINILNVLRGKK